MATLSELIESENLEYLQAPKGKIYTSLFGKPKNYRSGLLINRKTALTSLQRDLSKENFILEAVKKRLVTIPDDYEYCYRCSGTGKTHHAAYNGVCFKCGGLAILKRK